MTKDRTVSLSEQSKLLAISLLFGDAFLGKADPRLIGALQSSPQAWGDLLIASWRATSTAEDSRPQKVASPPAETTSPPLSDAPPPSPTETPPAPLEAPPFPPQDSTQNGTAENISPLAIFDPRQDPPVQTGAKKDCSREEIRAYLVNVIVEKTGYPPETFEEPLDFEADLGIDSIKQVEAMSEVRQHFELSLEEDFQMRDYPTLDAATDYIFRRLQGLPPEPPVASPQETATS
jgi:acyl carrier protein